VPAIPLKQVSFPVVTVLALGDTLPVADGTYLFTANYAGASPGAGYAVGDVWVRSSTVWHKIFTDATVPPALQTVAGPVVDKTGTALWRYEPQLTRLAANQTNNNAVANTLQDVTGLSFAVLAGVPYKFTFWVAYTAAATTTGSRWTLNGPAVTNLHYMATYVNSTTGVAVATYTSNAYNAAGVLAANSLAAGNVAKVEGYITPSAAGTVILRFASEIAASAIVALATISYVEFERIIP
jgi:hypothetical protein